MTITEVVYCTRADVQRALNLADVPRLNQRVDSAIMAGARQVEGLLHRRFYPETKTVKFDMPEDEFLWLYENELAGTPTQILSGGDAMTVDTDVILRPKSGPPYRWLEARFGGGVWWQAQDTVQNAIEITADSWNYPVDQVDVTTLASSMQSVQIVLTVTDSSQVGVGSLILIGSERMLVTEQSLASTAATIAADLVAGKAEVAIAVSDGSLINPGEIVSVDSEYMLVRSVTGDTLTVDRAVNGSVLATHTSGATVYAPRLCTVRRGRLGTSAAAHDSAATVSLLQAPSLVRELNLACAINNEEQSLAAYARTSGAADSARDASGRGVADLVEDAYTAYGRKARSRAI